MATSMSRPICRFDKLTSVVIKITDCYRFGRIELTPACGQSFKLQSGRQRHMRESPAQWGGNVMRDLFAAAQAVGLEAGADGTIVIATMASPPSKRLEHASGRLTLRPLHEGAALRRSLAVVENSAETDSVLTETPRVCCPPPNIISARPARPCASSNKCFCCCCCCTHERLHFVSTS